MRLKHLRQLFRLKLFARCVVCQKRLPFYRFMYRRRQMGSLKWHDRCIQCCRRQLHRRSNRRKNQAREEQRLLSPKQPVQPVRTTRQRTSDREHS